MPPTPAQKTLTHLSTPYNERPIPAPQTSSGSSTTSKIGKGLAAAGGVAAGIAIMKSLTKSPQEKAQGVRQAVSTMPDTPPGATPSERDLEHKRRLQLKITD